jgi:glycosyltransferase involved in cell wall biosynthesis
MTRIKVLHCITDLSPDGAQRTLLRLIPSLEQAGIESRVVCLAGKGALSFDFESAGFPAIHLGMHRKIPNLAALMRLRALIKEWQPHLVQGWMYHANVAALIASKMSGVATPVLWNVRRCLYDISRDRFGTRLTIRAGARLSRWVSRIIYCVELAALQHEELGFDSRVRIVVPNGVDMAKFKPAYAARAALRRELGVPDDCLVVGAVGRYHPQKDFEGFLRAAAAVAWGGSTAHFVLAGRGVSRDNPRLTALASELGISRCVHLLGERDDIPAIMSGLDIFVSSSNNEGFSNVLAEAMASGLPCVATDVGAAREVVRGVGRLVPPEEPLELGVAISEMLSLGADQRAEIGLRARTRIGQRYSVERMVERYAHLYRTVVYGPSAAILEEMRKEAA